MVCGQCDPSFQQITIFVPLQEELLQCVTFPKLKKHVHNTK